MSRIPAAARIILRNSFLTPQEKAVTSQGVIQSERDDSLAERAYRAIKRDIIRCELEPGGLVTEIQLAKRYRAGRAAVRSALNRLYQERLIQSMPRQGYRIAPVTLR